MGGELPKSVRRRLDEELDSLGVDDPEKRRRLRGRVLYDLDRRIAARVRRTLESEWTFGGRSPTVVEEPWIPKAPILAPDSVQGRVVRWSRQRADFSVRDLQRSFDWFETASDARECVSGLVARGLLEVVLPQRRPGRRGRMPDPRYRAVPVPDEKPQPPYHSESQVVWPEDGVIRAWPSPKESK